MTVLEQERDSAAETAGGSAPTGRSRVEIDPQDFLPVMRAAADLFCARLKVEHVGPDDDFFALGGGRVSAVWVARRLEQALGRPVPPALLFQARTPRAIHAALEGERQAETSHLVDLRAGGSQPELFCMPEVYGRPLSFITLADRVGPDQPVVGLAVGPAAADLIERRSMDVIASAYVDAILRRRPQGPFRLVGYSFGGVFAQEVAVRLHELGHEVSLVLVDAGNRSARVGVLSIAWWALRSMVLDVLSHRPRAAAGRSWRRAKLISSYAFSAREIRLPHWVLDVDRELATAHVDAWMTHRARPFHGRTLLVACREQLGFNIVRDVDGMIGWSRILKGPVTRVVADVGHQEVVREDYADRLAALMADFFAGEETSRPV